MKRINIPYSTKYLEYNIDESRLAGILESKAAIFSVQKTQNELINEAMDNPINSDRLEEIAKGKNDVVIITSDHTRPVPSKFTMPIILERLRRGNPKIKIDILIAGGFHRETTREELIYKFGDEIVANQNILIHNSNLKKDMINLGLLPSGGELWLNKRIIDTELLISEGFIEPHFFAGFSGGRKSVLPGVAMSETIMANHCAEFIRSPYARAGILENNPIHEDMIYAAKIANLRFILNVALDGNQKIISAFAGNSEKAHSEGCKFVKELSCVKAIPADIVLTSNGGYPLDQNIYQSVKGMSTAEATCNDGGVIIMVASCADGHGGKFFYDNMAGNESPREILDRVNKVAREDTIPDQWQFQILARILDKHTVIMVTDKCDPTLITNMQMQHAYTIEEAMQKAWNIKGKEAKVTIIPDGVGVIIN